MGSKISKAVRRPHVSSTNATALTPAGTTAHHDHGFTRERQAALLPEIKPLAPLVVDITSTSPAASSGPDTNSLPSATAIMALPMDAQPALPFSEPRNTEAIQSLAQVLLTDAQRSPDNNPQPSPPAVCLPPPPPPPAVAMASEPPPPPPEPEVTCIICCEPGVFSKDNKPIKACRPCGSTYCAPCLKDMFVAASKDISRMPPRCCIQIPLYHARPHLTEAEATEFKSKYEEWSTQNPLYCPVPTCSAFIPDRLIPQTLSLKGKQRIDSMVGTPTLAEFPCPTCNADICTKCRQRAHPGSMCGSLEFGVDEETAKLLKSWGYKRCPKCSNGVKRMFGCNHMECLCGAHWCWVCQKANEDCDGGCYEEDDDEYSDEENEDEEEAAQPPPPENTEAISTTGESSTQSAEEPVEESSATPVPPRIRNLDRHSRAYWEDSGLNFGAEPSDNYADQSWDCVHNFETTKVGFEDSLRKGLSVECSKCWCTVHPEIELPNAANKGGARMVSGAVRGYTGRGRGRRGFPRARGRGRGRGVTFQTHLDRSNAILGEAPNDELVMDTYGRMITTTEVDTVQPRRASLELPDCPSPLLSDVWMQYAQSQHEPDNFYSHPHPPFSFAYECTHCGLLVCSSCKDSIMAPHMERREREAAAAAEREALEAERRRQEEERLEAARIEEERQQAERREAERLEEERYEKLLEVNGNKEKLETWLGDFDL